MTSIIPTIIATSCVTVKVKGVCQELGIKTLWNCHKSRRAGQEIHHNGGTCLQEIRALHCDSAKLVAVRNSAMSKGERGGHSEFEAFQDYIKVCLS